MPYSYPKNVPAFIKKLPEGAQKFFIKVFNSVYDSSDGDDNKARIAAWGAVKQKYKKINDVWKKISSEKNSEQMQSVDSLEKEDDITSEQIKEEDKMPEEIKEASVEETVEEKSEEVSTEEVKEPETTETVEEKAEEAPKEESPVEEKTEEKPAEEAPKEEETEKPAEEVPVEDAPTEEVKDESPEEEKSDNGEQLQKEISLIREVKGELVKVYAENKSFKEQIEKLSKQIKELNDEKESLSGKYDSIIKKENAQKEQLRKERLGKLCDSFKKLGRDNMTIERLSKMDEETLEEFEKITEAAIDANDEGEQVEKATIPSEAIPKAQAVPTKVEKLTKEDWWKAQCGVLTEQIGKGKTTLKL